MRITQKQIAERVGVSNVAVSNVLHRSHSARISKQKQREILRVAHEMGYQPRQVTTHTVGFVIASGEMHLDTTENGIIFAHETLKARGYRMLFVMVDSEQPESLVDVLNPKTVDGVLVNSWCDGKIQQMLPQGVPWVVLSEGTVGDDVDQVSTDTVQVARNTTARLLELGHRRLCLVTGSAGIGYHERLKIGVTQALQNGGLAPDCVSTIEVQHNAHIGAPLLELMSSAQAPTAILAASAGKSIAALNRLQWAGYRVPEQISLISLGDGYRLTPLAPAISAATVFDRDVIEGGVERLIEKIKSPATPPQHILLPGRYIERESVALAPLEKGAHSIS